jgi:hypothetical protein
MDDANLEVKSRKEHEFLGEGRKIIGQVRKIGNDQGREKE